MTPRHRIRFRTTHRHGEVTDDRGRSSSLNRSCVSLFGDFTFRVPSTVVSAEGLLEEEEA